MGLRINLPARGQLTPEQKRVIDSDYSDAKAVLLTGVPGSGKTVASIYRMIDRCVRQKRPALLLTYHNLLAVAIRNTLQEQQVDGDAVGTVMRWFGHRTGRRLCPRGNHGDATEDVGRWLSGPQISGALQVLRNSCANCELFLDEGQDLPPSVFEAIPQFFERSFITADGAQKVHKDGADPSQIIPLLTALFGQAVKDEPLQFTSIP